MELCLSYSDYTEYKLSNQFLVMRARLISLFLLLGILLYACNPVHSTDDVKIRSMLTGNQWALVQGNEIQGYYSFRDDAHADWYNADGRGYYFLTPGVLNARKDNFSLLYIAMPYRVEDGILIIGNDKDGGFPIEILNELTLLGKENGIELRRIVSFAGD